MLDDNAGIGNGMKTVTGNHYAWKLYQLFIRILSISIQADQEKNDDGKEFIHAWLNYLINNSAIKRDNLYFIEYLKTGINFPLLGWSNKNGLSISIQNILKYV